MAKMWKPPGLHQRSYQILRYLQNKWPAPYPVQIRWVKDLVDDEDPEDRHYHAECYRDGLKIIIKLSKRRVRTYAEMSETVIHEYAHARDIKLKRLEDKLDRFAHGPEWGLYFAEMYSDFNDDLGWEVSRTY